MIALPLEAIYTCFWCGVKLPYKAELSVTDKRNESWVQPLGQLLNWLLFCGRQEPIPDLHQPPRGPQDRPGEKGLLSPHSHAEERRGSGRGGVHKQDILVWSVLPKNLQVRGKRGWVVWYLPKAMVQPAPLKNNLQRAVQGTRGLFFPYWIICCGSDFLSFFRNW